MGVFGIVIVGFFNGFCEVCERFLGFLVWFLYSPVDDEIVVICVIGYNDEFWIKMVIGKNAYK